MKPIQLEFNFKYSPKTISTFWMRIKNGNYVFIDTEIHTDFASDYRLKKHYILIVDLKNQTVSSYYATTRVLPTDRINCEKLTYEDYFKTSLILKQNGIIYNKKLGKFLNNTENP